MESYISFIWGMYVFTGISIFIAFTYRVWKGWDNAANLLVADFTLSTGIASLIYFVNPPDTIWIDAVHLPFYILFYFLYKHARAFGLAYLAQIAIAYQSARLVTYGLEYMIGSNPHLNIDNFLLSSNYHAIMTAFCIAYLLVASKGIYDGLAHWISSCPIGRFTHRRGS